MNLEIRQKVQNALQQAGEGNCRILIERKNHPPSLLQCDVTCFADHLEGTDHEGNWIGIAYTEIEDVSVDAGEKAGTG
jgi:hypothetical protein